jgi:hypothetical protein
VGAGFERVCLSQPKAKLLLRFITIKLVACGALCTLYEARRGQGFRRVCLIVRHRNAACVRLTKRR